MRAAAQRLKWGLAILVSAVVGIAARVRRPRFVIYTRTFNDVPYIQLFVDHYLELGFDRIVMLDMSELGMSLPPTAPPGRLEIHHFPNTKNDAIQQHQQLVVDAPWVEWVFFLDTDEYLLLRTPTIAQYVDELEASFGPVDLVQFRWALYEHVQAYCSELPLEQMLREPPGVLVNSHVKTLTKVFPGLILSHPHHPLLAQDRLYTRVVDGRAQRVLGQDVGFTAPAALPYVESALLHVHTRSVADLLTKATHGLPVMHRKPVDPDLMRELIVGRRSRGHALVHAFYKAGGTKAQLPAAHVGTGLITAKELNVSMDYAGERLEALLAPNSTLRRRGICDQRLERAEFWRTLAVLNVTYARFSRFAVDLERAFAIRFSSMAANYRSGGSPWGRRRRRLSA